ncbi:type II toxin-antitoxin system YafO family toxin [Photorhabdus cinerea]|uniref:type II toxin-antitoxin system YafO family toxin n=1 Tax=Photorhabdus cinerea TaxID=471575 RepID=UPI001A99C698
MTFGPIKEGKGLPVTFGRDVPYRFTHNRSYLELQHLHFKDKGFPLKLVQFKRTSGYVLVYCLGFFRRQHLSVNRDYQTLGS